MAKNLSLLRLKGNLGQLNFYESKGESLVRLRSSLTRERMMRDKSFERARENMSEFGGASMAGKAWRKGLSGVFPGLRDHRAVSRLTGIFRRIVGRNVSGMRGQRPVRLWEFGEELLGFEFNLPVPLGSVFRGDVDVQVNTDRNEVVFAVAALDPVRDIGFPEGASHFQFIGAVNSVSDYEFAEDSGRYFPLHPEVNGLGGIGLSPLVPLGSGSVGAMTFQAALPGSPLLPAQEASLTACLGVVFFQEVGGDFFRLESGKCMRVVGVW